MVPKFQLSMPKVAMSTDLYDIGPIFSLSRNIVTSVDHPKRLDLSWSPLD